MNSRKLLTAPLALAAGLTIALSGCGDDGDTSTTSDGAPSKAEFIAAVDEICTQTGATVNAEAQTRFPDGVAPGGGNEIENFFAEVTIPALGDQYEQIGELTPPEGDEDEVAAIVEAGNEAVAEAEEDPSTLNVLTGAKTPFDEVGELEREYGFEVCGAADPELDEG
jgi:hypothetical protein